MISGNGGVGVHIETADIEEGTDTIVRGNYIGVDVAGLSLLGNGAAGIHQAAGRSSWLTENRIGGNATHGIQLEVGAAIITANYIGTTPDGDDIGNLGDGVRVVNPGGPSASAYFYSDSEWGGANVIGLNQGWGVAAYGASQTCCAKIYMYTGFIGTDALGRNLGNALGGIRASYGGSLFISSRTSEAPLVTGRSTIGFNGGPGIQVDSGKLEVKGVYIGTDSSGRMLPNNGPGVLVANSDDKNAIGCSVFVCSAGRVDHADVEIAYNQGPGISVINSNFVLVRGPSIHSNTGIPIDLGDDGITANDPGDFDTGANFLLNRPSLYAADSGYLAATNEFWVSYALDIDPDDQFYPNEIDFYSSNLAGEPLLYLGTGNYLEDDALVKVATSFDWPAEAGNPIGARVVAIANGLKFDKFQRRSDHSSEVSPPITVPEPSTTLGVSIGLIGLLIVGRRKIVS